MGIVEVVDLAFLKFWDICFEVEFEVQILEKIKGYLSSFCNNLLLLAREKLTISYKEDEE